MSTVKRVRQGIRLRLETEEAALVKALMEQILTLLGDPPESGDELASLGIAENASKSEDPVLARLFPDAYREDPEAAGEFRRYTEVGLKDGKRAAIGIVLATVRAEENFVLDDDQVTAWLRALNDVRLALGTRLGITEEWYAKAAELDWDDPRYAMFAAYDWLTMLQEGLVQAVSAS